MIVFLQPLIIVLLSVSIIALQLSRESYLEFPASIFMLVRPVQQLNAEPEMLVTEFGMLMLVKPEQP